MPLLSSLFSQDSKREECQKAFLSYWQNASSKGYQKKPLFYHAECARPRALSIPLCKSLTHIESCSFDFAPFLLHATCDIKSSSQIGLKISLQVAECARPRALSLL